MRVPVVQPLRSEPSRPRAVGETLAAFPGPVVLYPSYVRRARAGRILGAIVLALAVPAYGLYFSGQAWTAEWTSEELCDLLNPWRTRALADSESSSAQKTSD